MSPRVPFSSFLNWLCARQRPLEYRPLARWARRHAFAFHKTSHLPTILTRLEDSDTPPSSDVVYGLHDAYGVYCEARDAHRARRCIKLRRARVSVHEQCALPTSTISAVGYVFQ